MALPSSAAQSQAPVRPKSTEKRLKIGSLGDELGGGGMAEKQCHYPKGRGGLCKLLKAQIPLGGTSFTGNMAFWALEGTNCLENVASWRHTFPEKCRILSS